MKRKILTYLYRKNESLFADIIVQEFYGSVPNNLRTPAMDFLNNGRVVLEKFFSIQAYHIARKALGDIKNQSFYDGQLMFIKALVLAVSKSADKKVDPIDDKPIEDPMKGVSEFMDKVKTKK